MLTHTLHEALRLPCTPLNIGAGGNGSKLTTGMKNLHGALRALGYPGIQLTLADGDTVSTSNLVRQSFYLSDVGLSKATVLIYRINTSCGLAWEAVPRHVTAHDLKEARIDLLVSCVDSRAARHEIASELQRSQTSLPEDDTPSCSTMEALEKQDLFINDTLVTSALALLWRLLRHGETTHHSSFVDLKTGSVRPLPIDPALWRRLRRQR